jgi:hypothetical protein
MSNLNNFVKELYDKSIESMQWWVQSLENKYDENIYSISNTVFSLEKFFGEDINKKVRIITLTSGSTDDIQGSVMSNYTDSDSPYFKGIDESVGDIDMYFSLIDDENNGVPIQPVESVLSSLFHEVMHQRLQKEKFFNLIKEVEKDSDIKKIVGVLKENSGSYMEITMELITQYVTSYVEHCIKNKISNGCKDKRYILEFVQGYDIFKKLMSANILSIVKNERLDSAFTRSLSNYIELVGYIPEEIKEEYEELKKEKGEEKGWRENKLNIYKMAYRFDLGLVTEYMKEGKELDTYFIKQMYELVKEEIAEYCDELGIDTPF